MYTINIDSSKFQKVRENIGNGRHIYGEKLKRRIYMADIELYEELQE